VVDTAPKARPQRVLVVGPSGSGKSTLARHLSELFDLPHVELDALYWGPNWTKRETFEAEVAECLAQDAWIVDGGFGAVKDVSWPRSELVVWLDLPFISVFARQFRRSIRRSITGEELFGGNRETLRSYFLSRQSLMLWLIKSYRPTRQRHLELAAQHHTVPVVRLTSRRAVEVWFASVASR